MTPCRYIIGLEIDALVDGPGCRSLGQLCLLADEPSLRRQLQLRDMDDAWDVYKNKLPELVVFQLAPGADVFRWPREAGHRWQDDQPFPGVLVGQLARQGGNWHLSRVSPGVNEEEKV
jgi:hypothetical protein